VIEAGRRSGSLSTARWAVEYGRTVFALPGPWSSPQSAGCHDLVTDGATLAGDPEGLLQALAVEAGASVAASGGLARSSGDAAILGVLAGGPLPFDQVAFESGLGRAAFVLAVTELLSAGRLRRLPGNLLAHGP
jgi:DNA processing protein